MSHRVFVYREGLARFCTTPYARPSPDNLGTLTAHLTNYAVNKRSTAFVAPRDARGAPAGGGGYAPAGAGSGAAAGGGGAGPGAGTASGVGPGSGEDQRLDEGAESSHKWSFAQLRAHLEAEGRPWAPLWGEVQGLVAKSLIAIAPLLRDAYRSAFPSAAPCGPAPRAEAGTSDGAAAGGIHRGGAAAAGVSASGSRCFELLGFDVLIDEGLRPWLVEVNHSPSFGIDSPLDRWARANRGRRAIVRWIHHRTLHPPPPGFCRNPLLSQHACTKPLSKNHPAQGDQAGPRLRRAAPGARRRAPYRRRAPRRAPCGARAPAGAGRRQGGRGRRRGRGPLVERGGRSTRGGRAQVGGARLAAASETFAAFEAAAVVPRCGSGSSVWRAESRMQSSPQQSAAEHRAASNSLLSPAPARRRLPGPPLRRARGTSGRPPTPAPLSACCRRRTPSCRSGELPKRCFVQYAGVGSCISTSLIFFALSHAQAEYERLLEAAEAACSGCGQQAHPPAPRRPAGKPTAGRAAAAAGDNAGWAGQQGQGGRAGAPVAKPLGGEPLSPGAQQPGDVSRAVAAAGAAAGACRPASACAAGRAKELARAAKALRAAADAALPDDGGGGRDSDDGGGCGHAPAPTPQTGIRCASRGVGACGGGVGGGGAAGGVPGPLLAGAARPATPAAEAALAALAQAAWTDSLWEPAVLPAGDRPSSGRASGGCAANAALAYPGRGRPASAPREGAPCSRAASGQSSRSNGSSSWASSSSGVTLASEGGSSSVAGGGGVAAPCSAAPGRLPCAAATLASGGFVAPAGVPRLRALPGAAAASSGAPAAPAPVKHAAAAAWAAELQQAGRSDAQPVWQAPAAAVVAPAAGAHLPGRRLLHAATFPASGAGAHSPLQQRAQHPRGAPEEQLRNRQLPGAAWPGAWGSLSLAWVGAAAPSSPRALSGAARPQPPGAVLLPAVSGRGLGAAGARSLQVRSCLGPAGGRVPVVNPLGTAGEAAAQPATQPPGAAQPPRRATGLMSGRRLQLARVSTLELGLTLDGGSCQ